MTASKWLVGMAVLGLAASAPAQEGGPGPTDGEQMKKLIERVRQLEEQLAEIQQARQDEELEKLRMQAGSEAASAPDEIEKLEEKSYVTASRSLQMLNPEISVSGDFLAQVIFDEDLNAFYAGADDRSGMVIRALDMHVQSSLDPFSLTKLALGFEPGHGVEVEELYMTWTGIIPQARLTVGMFRQQLGVLNRWHEHDLDQVQYPLVLTELLGAEGLAQTGVGLSWTMPPLWAHANELSLQITNASNETLFAGDFFSVPSGLIHIKSYWDLSENTYLELGLSGMFGMNNRRGMPSQDDPDLLLDEDWRSTFLAGADLTLHWQPLRRARYRSLTWRSEGLWVRKQAAGGALSGWGLYTYLQYQLGASWFAGLRGDLVQPLWHDDKLLWQAVVYATFWQSEFVYIRLQASHGEVGPEGHDTRLVLQVNWAAGPHKHEKY